MKRLVSLMIVVSLFLAACGGGSFDVSVEEPPVYEDGVEYPFVISVTDGGEGIEGLDILATLEMARMDHGIIEVHFTDAGGGIYEGEVALPMGGEWIANLEIDEDGKVSEETVVFDVAER